MDAPVLSASSVGSGEIKLVVQHVANATKYSVEISNLEDFSVSPEDKNAKAWDGGADAFAFVVASPQPAGTELRENFRFDGGVYYARVRPWNVTDGYGPYSNTAALYLREITPVLPGELRALLPTGADGICATLVKFFKWQLLFYRWYKYAFPSGAMSPAFQVEICYARSFCGDPQVTNPASPYYDPEAVT